MHLKTTLVLTITISMITTIPFAQGFHFVTDTAENIKLDIKLPLTEQEKNELCYKGDKNEKGEYTMFHPFVGFSKKCYPKTDGYAPLFLKQPVVKSMCLAALKDSVLLGYCKKDFGTIG